MTTLLWVRKTLRIADNPLLKKVCENSACVVPVFILDKWHCNVNNLGNVRYRFLVDAMACMDRALRERGVPNGLCVVFGEVEEIIPQLCQRAKSITSVAFDDSEENEPHVRESEAKLRAWAAQSGSVDIVNCAGHWLHSPQQYEKRFPDGPPTNMRSFQKVFGDLGKVPSPVAAPDTIPGTPGLHAKIMQAWGDLVHKVPETAADHAACGHPNALDINPKWRGGEDVALDRVEAMITARPEWTAAFSKPDTKPNGPDDPTTTVISPYLTHGCVSARTVWHAILDAKARADKSVVQTHPPVSLTGQLMWRELWYTVARVGPSDLNKAGNALARPIPWRDSADDTTQELLAAWREGRTGYPFIDAIMIQLRDEGWIHHLARHAASCFLTRGQLWVSWEEGAAHFDSHLVDADWSLNACNWMWVSCSAFFHQYFRVYSPVAFGKKTDPKGLFIRKYIPQLAKFPDKYIYEPYLAPLTVQIACGCKIGSDYPAPVVKHKEVCEENKNKMKQVWDAAKAIKAGAGAAAAAPPPPPPAQKRARKA